MDAGLNAGLLILVVVGLVVVHECGHAAAAHLLGLTYHVRLRRRPFRVVVAVLFPGDVIPWQNMVIARQAPW